MAKKKTEEQEITTVLATSDDLESLIGLEFNLTNEGIKNYSNDLAYQISKSDHILDDIVRLRTMYEVIENVLGSNHIKDRLVEETIKTGKKSFLDQHGIRISVRELQKYDYNSITDKQLQELEHELDGLKGLISARKKYLVNRAGQLDELTGKVFCPPEKTTVRTYAVTYPKEV